MTKTLDELMALVRMFAEAFAGKSGTLLPSDAREKMRLYAAEKECALESALRELIADAERMRAALENPPRHHYWGAGEVDCPAELKARNGELHTLRCKVCGAGSTSNPICLAAIDAQRTKASE